jgi:endogenous inhibitor of DNA gyrase (YacG/DUF329 family)
MKIKSGMKHTCPICSIIIKPSDLKRLKDEHYFPFCCERCKLIDLGIWLEAGYKVVSNTQSQEPDILPETTFVSDNQ